MEFIVLSFQKSLHAAERQPGDWGWVSGWGDMVFVCSDVNGGVNTLGYLVCRARRQGFRWKIRRLLKLLFKSGLPSTWQFPAFKSGNWEAWGIALAGWPYSRWTGRRSPRRPGVLGHAEGPWVCMSGPDSHSPGERVGVPLGGKVWVVSFQSPMLNYGQGQGPWARLTSMSPGPPCSRALSWGLSPPHCCSVSSPQPLPDKK